MKASVTYTILDHPVIALAKQNCYHFIVKMVSSGGIEGTDFKKAWSFLKLIIIYLAQIYINFFFRNAGQKPINRIHL